MIITFSNRKGRVGKTSLCMALANYWASKGVPVKVIDVDPQQSLYVTRENDSKKDDVKPKYDIFKFDLVNHLDECLECIKIFKQLNFHILFDTPAGIDAIVFMHIIKLADYIIVPFQYETISIDLTGRYSMALGMLMEISPKSRTIIYVPNMVDKTKEFFIHFFKAEKVESESKSFYGGIRTPCIPLCSCIEKMNTLYLTSEALVYLSPCLDSLTSIILNGDQIKLNQK